MRFTWLTLVVEITNLHNARDKKGKKVPTFPIQSRSNLFKVVIDTLINNKPPFWLDYFNDLMKRDVILQEAHQSKFSEPVQTPGIPAVGISASKAKTKSEVDSDFITSNNSHVKLHDVIIDDLVTQQTKSNRK